MAQGLQSRSYVGTLGAERSRTLQLFVVAVGEVVASFADTKRHVQLQVQWYL